MAAPQTFPFVSDATREEINTRGAALYETLQPQIEPEYDKKFIAIHVDSGNYKIARSAVEAVRALRHGQPADGRVYARKIGMEPEYGLAARLLLSDSLGGPK